MTQTLFVQATLAFVSLAMLVFLSVYTWLTRGDNFRNPIGLTLVMEGLLWLADISVAFVRWFGPLTPQYVSAEVWAQGGILASLGVILVWRTVVFASVSRHRRLLWSRSLLSSPQSSWPAWSSCGSFTGCS